MVKLLIRLLLMNDRKEPPVMPRKMYLVLTSLLAFFLIGVTTVRADSKDSINFVAVGDSLTEGVGDTTKQQGYTKRTAKQISKKYNVKVDTSNYGKAGDRSDQILARIKVNAQAKKDIKNADVITLTVGGNDLQQTLFKAVLARSESAVTRQVEKAMPDYTENLTRLINYLKKQNKQAPIYLFGNYNPLYVYLANRNDLNDDVKIYNDINANLASVDDRVYYVSTFRTLTFGQYKTKASREKLQKKSEAANRGSLNNKMVTETLTSGKNEELNQYITTQDHYHPNNLGYDKMSALLVKKMSLSEQEWLKK